MVAGRVGSGMASELGSMLVTEQINAMRALGTDPIKKLVVPRFWRPLRCCRCSRLLPTARHCRRTCGCPERSPHHANLYLSRAWDSLDYMDLFGGLLKPLVFGATLRWSAVIAACEPTAEHKESDVRRPRRSWRHRF